MRKIVHLSDLHFGRTDDRVVKAVTAMVQRLAPDVVVVSGDLTQRARSGQFKEARAFIDGLPGEKVVVPGNHDVPLHNIWARTFRPLAKYRKFIGQDLAPRFMDDEIAVLGLSTARSLVVKNGRVNQEQIALVRAAFEHVPAGATKVLVTHHPFDLPPTHDAKALVGRARLAMETFSQIGVDLLIAGHIHVSYSGSSATRYRLGDFSAIAVQAGTATSTRRRGEVNTFNVLEIERDRIAIATYAWSERTETFAIKRTGLYARTGKEWRAVQALRSLP